MQKPSELRKIWKETAQPWEFDYWSTRLCEAVDTLPTSQMICSALELVPAVIAGRTLLDVGCGPTGRLSALKDCKSGAQWWALDPLGDKYRTLPWADLSAYDNIVSLPAETHVPELVNKFDIIISLNALDHGYHLFKALQNIYSYLKADGWALISFDCTTSKTPDPTHPIRVSRLRANSLMKKAKFKITKCDNRVVFPDRTSWGHSVHWHWWLRK